MRAQELHDSAAVTLAKTLSDGVCPAAIGPAAPTTTTTTTDDDDNTSSNTSPPLMAPPTTPLANSPPPPPAPVPQPELQEQQQPLLPPQPRPPVQQQRRLIAPAVERKIITRSENGIRLKRPTRELPAPTATKPTPKRVQLNASMKFCLDIIRELLTKKHQDYAWPFYYPVSTDQYPDYLEIVKKPIDLNTIKTKIETGQYRTVKPFVKDMRLMFTNCLRYNKPEAPVIEQARKLRDFFEYRYARIPEELLTEKMVTTNGTHHQNHSHSQHNGSHNNHSRHQKVESDTETDSESHQRMKLLETQVKLLTTTISALTGIADTRQLKPKNGLKKNANNRSSRKRPAAKSSPAKSHHRNGDSKRHRSSGHTNGHHLEDESDDDSDEESDDGSDDESDDDSGDGLSAPSPIAFDANDMDDLKQLKTDLENLDAKDLMNVLRILRATEPSIKCDDDDDSIEMDFEALKPQTLIALRKFVSSCMLNSKH